MNKLFILLSFVMIILDCSAQLKIIEIPEIKNAGASKNVPLSTIFSKSHIVRLETTRESLISHISQFKIYNDKIYILDSASANALFVFSMKGKFIRKIGSKGKGPGEYLQPWDFVIDEETNSIILYARKLNKLMTFSIDGEFLSEKEMNFSFNSFLKLDNDFLFDVQNTRIGGVKDLNTNKSKFFLVKTDSNMNITQKIRFKDSPSLWELSSSKCLSYNDLGIFFKLPYLNELYKLNEDGLNEEFIFEYNNTEISKSLFEKHSSIFSFQNEIKNNEYVYIPQGYYDIINNVLFFSVYKGHWDFTCAYSLKTKKVYMELNRMKNDMNSLGFYGFMVGQYKNYVVNYLQTDWLLQPTAVKIPSHEKEIISKTKLGDNPILIFNEVRNDL